MGVPVQKYILKSILLVCKVLPIINWNWIGQGSQEQQLSRTASEKSTNLEDLVIILALTFRNMIESFAFPGPQFPHLKVTFGPPHKVITRISLDINVETLHEY